MKKYVVRKGDTLQSIAEEQLKNKNKWSQIANLNQLSYCTSLKEGQELHLPLTTYVVGPFDSFHNIVLNQLNKASDVEEIALLNGLTRPYQVKPGQVLYLPSEKTGQRAQKIDSAEYIVQPGDSLSKIAQKYLGSVSRSQEIAQLNGISLKSVLKVGQKLRLPAGATHSQAKPGQPKSVIDHFPAVRQEIKTLLGELYPASLYAEDKTFVQRKQRACQIFIMILAKISWLEGFYPYMYPDPKGIATVGLGYNVEDIEKAKALNFYIGTSQNINHFALTSESIKATQDQIAAAHSYVFQQGKSDIEKLGAVKTDKAAYFKAPNNLILPYQDVIDISQSFLDIMLTKDIEDHFNVKKATVPYTEYPVPALVGLIDLIYNCGIGKLMAPASQKGFPKFVQAVREGNWIEAAKESKRGEIPGHDGIVKRNILDYELFILAARLEGQLGN